MNNNRLPRRRATSLAFAMSVASPLILNAQAPPELDSLKFSGPDITPCPACLCSAPTGEVFVGVDLLGSLGKGAGKGRIVRLVDADGDGTPETHSVYTEIDNPRGLISVGTKLYVLHTVIPKSTGILESMNLSVFEDKDWDGVADGEGKILISDVSPPKHNQDRGADHTTNGIRMGIDGWIYIAVGDFGIHGAKGTDGTELTMLGGGVVRLRPDGSELEVYTHGLRNIYDIAIDPLMNIYTRGNTNDGGGWNVRFIHHIQSGEYGYPVLFKSFTDEIIPALVDVGGGSGTGSLFLQEPGWPDKFNNVPMMCDWGRSQLVIHRLTPDGASFTQEPENFIKLSQISDIDVDASGRLYGAAWNGAGYSGNPGKGFVQRYVPKGWTYKPFANPSKLKDPALVALLRSESATARLAASQELLNRPPAVKGVISVATDQAASLESRVAAIFTYKQMAGKKANPGLVKLTADPLVKEWAMRALTDRKTQLDGVTKELFVAGLKNSSPRVQVAAAVSLGRLGDRSAAPALLTISSPPGEAAPADLPKPLAFQSKVISGKKSVKIDVDISAFKQVYLIVTDGGNGTGNDHAAWFTPVFENAAGKETKLSSLKWKSAKSGWGKIGFGKSAAGGKLKTTGGVDSPDGLGTHADSVIVYEVPKGATRFKATGGLASTSKGGNVRFIVSETKSAAVGGSASEGPHATPNPEILVPHIAVKALVDLHAASACVDAVGGPNSRGALWALRRMHDVNVVDGLIAKYGSSAAGNARVGILQTLIRLYHQEAPYDGSWWWGTRPDTRGPYYKLAKWEASDKIEIFVRRVWEGADGALRQIIAASVTKNRAGLTGMDAALAAKTEIKPADPTVNLAKIAGKKGQIGKTSIEDVMLSLKKLKGKPELGKKLFTAQGCIACHTVEKGQALKGPFMGQVGAILSPEQIAESILKPNASISQGFATVLIETKDGKSITGFVTAESADELELRDIAGKAYRVKTSNLKKRTELEISMMPPGLANALSLDDFAALVAFLFAQKG